MAFPAVGPTAALQIGGMRLAFNPKASDAFGRLVDAQLNVSGWPSLKSYTGDIMLVTSNYVANGGDK